MNFDWQNFLDKHGVEYADRGPSTAKGNLYIACPFCGQADQGKHMGVSLHGRGWGCWREQTHRGHNPVRLVQALLRCDWAEANALVGGTRRLTADFAATVRAKLGTVESEDTIRKLEMPKSFRPLMISNNPHTAYLRDRGFDTEDIKDLVPQFDLRACLTQDREWNYRLIFPVRSADGDLLTWTGRSVGASPIRYKSLTTSSEKTDEQTALCPISDCFLGETHIKKIHQGKTNDLLLISEGPFDCLKLFLGTLCFEGLSIFSTCLFGKAISPAQIDKLAMLRSKYYEIVLLLDPDATTSAMRMVSQLRPLNIKQFTLAGKKDPGDMNAREVDDLLKRVAHRFF